MASHQVTYRSARHGSPLASFGSDLTAGFTTLVMRVCRRGSGFRGFDGVESPERAVDLLGDFFTEVPPATRTYRRTKILVRLRRVRENPSCRHGPPSGPARARRLDGRCGVGTEEQLHTGFDSAHEADVVADTQRVLQVREPLPEAE